MNAIYKGYDQEALDLQYNNRHHVPDFADYLSRWATLARLTFQRNMLIRQYRYGNRDRETLDVLLPGSTPVATLVFIHGGYWHLFDKSLFYFIADAFAPASVATVVLNYPLAPAASMDQIAASCVKGLRWLTEYGDALELPGKRCLAGHSAGAHLAAMAISSGRIQGETLTDGCCLLSGLYNLLPLQRSYLNGVLQMSEEMALRNSPVNRLPDPGVELLVVTGADETQEFRDQSVELNEKWGDHVASMRLLSVPQANHFSILDTLCDPQSVVHKQFIDMLSVPHQS
jgi:arylformamidase